MFKKFFFAVVCLSGLASAAQRQAFNPDPVVAAIHRDLFDVYVCGAKKVRERSWFTWLSQGNKELEDDLFDLYTKMGHLQQKDMQIALTKFRVKWHLEFIPFFLLFV